MKFALLIFYAAGTLAAPVLDDRYPKAEVKEIDCTSSRFRPGTTFEYAYAGETMNHVEGSSKQSTGLQISTIAFITQLDGCMFHMRLTNSKLSTKGMNDKNFKVSAESAALQEALETNDLIFTMEGNTIKSLRPRESETTEALNIKRGILSTLQLDDTKTSETDINGACKYEITKKDGVIVKTKTLSECSDRALNVIGIQSTSIKTGSDLKPLNSLSTCTYSLDTETIRSVTCEEKHLFRPFSAGYKTPSGAMTIVKQKLAFNGYTANSKKYDANANTLEKSLAFDHTVETKQTESLTEQVEVVIQRLITATKTSAQEFTSLVMLFRKMSPTKMAAVWNKYFDCTKSRVCGPDKLALKDLYRQYMLDAIAYCGTPSCIAVVKDVTISGEIAGERANMFLQSIALVAKTTNSMIRDILEIAQQKPSRQVFMTLGTLISRHCAKTPAECDLQAGTAVITALNFLEKTLDECDRQDDPERVEEILITLKAIGNAKRPTNVRSALIKCARKSIHSNITVSAFDALRGMPCDSNTLHELRQAVTDQGLDADKRIYAFQAAMKCPTNENVQLLVEAYNMEKNNQLASFMWTFFTNILESNNPDTKEAKTILATITNDTPLKKTDLPMYQYSKNFEKSLYLDSLKTGVSAQANLVFHPDGFLPKTAMFDMTAKVMGVPVELVETVVGIDGIETVLENAFGPDGVLPKEFNLKMFNWSFSTEKLKEMVEKRVRRGVKKPAANDENTLINDIHDTINKKPTKPSGFMSLKVMGQEVRVMSYDDIYAMIEQIDNMNVIQLLLNWAKGGEKTFSKSLMFLEMTHCVPTALGLPLKLKLTGSTVGTVELSGKFDIRSLFWGPTGLNLNGFVKPSAVVDISGNMGVESTFVSTGLLVSNNMMVSNLMKGSINYKEGEILKITMDTPSEPVQLFYASSTPYMYMNEKNDMIEGAPRIIKADKCLKSQLIGYGLCTSLRAPVAFRDYEAPYFPLSGPAHIGLTLVRGDDKLTTFQFKTTMTKITNGVEGAIEFSTPGAVYERKLSAKMLYTDANNDKELTLLSERVGSVKFSHNSLTYTTSLEAKTNLFKKDLVTRAVFFNQKNTDGKQTGVQVSAKLGDLYKFKHVTKYVSSASGPSLETMTEYAPNKKISAALKYDTPEQKVKATVELNQFKQSAEVSAKVDYTDNTKGLTLAFVHIPTGKTASLYTAYSSGGGKNEIIMNANVFGRPIKNILGLYRDGGKTTVRNFFLFQRRTATVDATYENKDGTKEIQLNADIFGRRGMANVLYTNQGTERVIRITADAAGKRVSTTMIVTNMEVEKSIRITVDYPTKVAEATLGYYNMRDTTIFKIDGQILGRKAELFWKLRKIGGYQSTIGGVVDKYVYGMKSMYGNSDPKQKSLCSSVYYGTTEAEKVAAEACMKYLILDSDDRMHRQVECSLNLPELKKRVAVIKDMVYQPTLGRFNMALRTMYNDETLCTKRLTVLSKGLTNSAIEFDVEAGKYTASWKIYSHKRETVTDIGLLLKAMDKKLLFLNQYEEVRVEGDLKAKITSSIELNGNKLPVSTAIDYLNRNGEAITSLSLNIGKYTVKQSGGLLYGNTRYGYGLATEMLVDGERMTKVFVDYVATVTESKFALDNMFGFSLKAREFKYGWHVEYENRSFGLKRTHVLKGNLQYATNRMSSVTVMFADSEKTAAMEIDVEYIPTKKISHFARFNKERRQLDVSLEFLPKMFVNFMVRLDNKIGYELTTSANAEWANFRRVLKIINSYQNNEKVFKVSTSLAGDITIGMEINKLSPQSLTLSATAYGNVAKVIATYQNMQLRLDVVVNDKKLVKVEGNYDQVTKSIRMFAVRKEQILFDITTGYNKMMNAFNMAVAGARKYAGVNINIKGQRTVVSFSFMSKGVAKIVLNKEQNSLAIQLKSTVSFLFKYAPKSNTVSITMKTNRNRITLMTSADWKGKVASVNLMINKERFGLKVLLLKNALNIKLIATPLATMKVVFSYVGTTLKMDVQRITKEAIISEASFKYILSKDASAMLFNWNTETISKLNEMIQPVLAGAAIQGKILFVTAMKNTDKLIALSKEAKTEILNFINKLEKAFDNFDFIAARDEVGALTLKALRKLSMVTVEALTSIANTLDKVKDRVPEAVEKLRGLIKDIKALNINIEDKAKEAITKAKVLVKRGREMIIKGQELLKDMKLDENVREIVDVVMKVAGNLTEATRPVVEKAITLLKDFKIRGRRLEDIVKMASTEGQKYMKMYVEKATNMMKDLKAKATVKVNELKAQIITACNKATDYLMKLKVPYTDKTVAQVIEMIKTKITELKAKVESMDAEGLIKDLKKTVMSYKIKGKNITQYINEIQAQVTEMKAFVETLAKKYQVIIKDLPEATRKTLQQVLAISRKYIADMDKYITAVNTYITEVKKFAEPLVEHITFVKSSVTKHFGPIINKIVTRIVTVIKEIELPAIRPIIDAELKKVIDFFVPLIKPIVPLYRNLLAQVRALSIMGLRIGNVVDMQVEMIDTKLNEWVTMTKANMNKQLAYLKMVVEKIKEQTPEYLIEKSYTLAMNKINTLIADLNRIYEQREALTQKTTVEVMRVYNKLKDQYKKVTLKSFDEVTEKIIKGSSEGIMITTGELSNLIKQVVAMDISGPTWKAWTDADIIGQLERYGVNEKIAAIIKSAKKANMTTLIFKTIASIQDFVNASIMKSSVKALELYNKLNTVMKYLKSIPKKNYDEWLNEMTQFTLRNKAAVEKVLQTVYETSRTQALKAYETVEKLAKEDAMKLFKEYSTVAKEWYEIIAEKSQLVYDEVKQPTIDVYNHYKTNIVDFLTKQYLMIKKILTTEYEKMYANIKARIGELRVKVEEKINEIIKNLKLKVDTIKGSVEKMYNEFLAKYGDLTWDDVAIKIEALVLKQFEKAKEQIVMQYEKILEKTNEIKKQVEAKVLEMYNKAIVEYKRIVEIVQTKLDEAKSYVEKKVDEIKPKVMEVYKKYEGMIRMKTEELLTQAKAMIAEAKAKATAIYNLNKDKTLKQIFNEIKKIILDNYLKQKEYINALADKNFEKANQLLNEAKTKAMDMYMTVGLKMRTVVIPELMAEAESIINQTLRNTVIMTKEIIKAYKPHVIIAKDLAKKYIEIIKLQAPILLEKAKALLKMDLTQAKKMLDMNIAKVQMKLKELIETLKKNEKYTKYVAILEKKVLELKGIVEAKINELSTNPSLLKMKAEIETRITQLKKLIKEKVEQIKNNPKFISAKNKIEDAIKVARELIDEYQAKLDVYVKQAIKLLKQIQKSGKFTAEQLKVNLKPYVDRATANIKNTVSGVPAIASRSLQYFADSPEEAFWNGIEVYSEAVTGAMTYAKLLNKEFVVFAFMDVYQQGVAFSKDLYNKTTDDWTKATIKKFSSDIIAFHGALRAQYKTLLAQGKDMPAMMKAYYEKNLTILKTKIAALKKWTNKQIEELMAYWETSAFKTIFENPIWGELSTELKNHELIALAKEIKEAVTVKVTELKATITPILKEQYETLKALAEKKYALVEEKLALAKTEGLKLYIKLNEKITWIINNAEKIFEETTIADIVAFIEKQYKQSLVKLAELKDQAKEMYAKYEAKAKELYAKYETQAKELYAKYETKVKALIKEYKGKLMPYYNKLMATYKKYYQVIEMKTKEIIGKVTEKYNTIKKMVVEKYTDILAKTLDLIKKYKTKSIEEMKKIRETLIKKWEESEIRAKLNEFRKMTIRQTIEALKKLPTAIYKDIVAKYNMAVAEIKKFCDKYCAKFQEKVQQVLEKIMKMLKPYLDNVKSAYGAVEYEIKETALFVYNYYGLEEKYNTMKNFIEAEIKRIIALTKEKLPLLTAILRRYADLYKESITKSATKYAEQYKKVVDVYARQARDFARTTGDKTLRGIHSGMKMVDSFDIEKIKTKVMDFIKNIAQYVIVTRKDGELKIEITHPDIKPIVMYYTKLIRINLKEALKQVNINVKQMLKKVKIELNDIKEKADRLRMKIQEAVMRNSAELRRDFNISIKVNKNIANRIFEAVKAVVMKNYKLAKAQYDILEMKARAMVDNATVMAKKYYKQLAMTAEEVYAKVEAIVKDIASQKTPKEMYEQAMLHLSKNYNQLKTNVMTMVETYKPIIETKLNELKAEGKVYYEKVVVLYKQLKNGSLEEYLVKLKAQAKVMMGKADETAQKLIKVVIAATETAKATLVTAYKELKAGIPAEEVFRPLITKVKDIYAKLRGLVQNVDVRGKLCANNLELCKLIDESIAVHKVLITKYVEKLRSLLSVGKAQVDRTVRKLNKQVKERNIAEKYTATAMLMGDHLLTFDNKLYNFVDFVKARNEGVNPCRYLLARDFQDKKFTIVKSEGAITVETKDMAIKIREDGRTKTTMGNGESTSLPVEVGKSQCIRIDNLILCHFKDERMKITVDLKNLFTVISISGWYKGKTRGLLGTYNNEGHDEWKLPDSTITKNINEFINKYELTGKPECQLDIKTDHATTCIKPMSKKCKTFFMSETSPFSKYFNSVDPKPFMELCKKNTKCEKRSTVKSLCAVVASYVTMLRTKGIWVSHPNQCMADKGRDVNEEWAQKPMKKAIDLVVMVSQKENMVKMRKRIATTMYQLHRSLKKEDKFQVRYALVGFGGAGVHEPAHTHPLRRGQTVFGYINDLNTEIKAMPYTGTTAHTNDGYHAILKASRLKFRRGAEKIFVMFNSEPHTQHESGPSFDETKYILENEANAPLIVFDTVNFANYGKGIGRVLGETKRKLYTTKNLDGVGNSNLDMPASEFKELILLSKGGLFSNTAISKPKQAAISLRDVVVNWISKDIRVCKRCVLRNSWTGQSRPICISDSTAEC